MDPPCKDDRQEGIKSAKKSKKIVDKNQVANYDKKVAAIKAKYCPMLENLINKITTELLHKITAMYDILTSGRRLRMVSLIKIERVLEKLYKNEVKPSKPHDKEEADKNRPPNTDKPENSAGVSYELFCNNKVDPRVKKKSRWDLKEVREKVVTEHSDLEVGNLPCGSDSGKTSYTEKQKLPDNSINEILTSKKSRWDMTEVHEKVVTEQLDNELGSSLDDNNFEKTPVENSTKQSNGFKTIDNNIDYPSETENSSTINTSHFISDKTSSFENPITRGISRNIPSDLIDNQTFMNLKKSIQLLGLSKDVESSVSKAAIDSVSTDVNKEVRTNISECKVLDTHQYPPALKKPLQTPNQSFIGQSKLSHIGGLSSNSVYLPQGNYYDYYNFYPYQGYQYPYPLSNNQEQWHKVHYHPVNQTCPPNSLFSHAQVSSPAAYTIPTTANRTISECLLSKPRCTNSITEGGLSMPLNTSQNQIENFDPICNLIDKGREVKKIVSEKSQPRSKYSGDNFNNGSNESSRIKDNQDIELNQCLSRNLVRKHNSSMYAKPLSKNSRPKNLNSNYIPKNNLESINCTSVSRQTSRKENNISNFQPEKQYDSSQRLNGVEHDAQSKIDYVSPLAGLYDTQSNEPTSYKGTKNDNKALISESFVNRQGYKGNDYNNKRESNTIDKNGSSSLVKQKDHIKKNCKSVCTSTRTPKQSSSVKLHKTGGIKQNCLSKKSNKKKITKTEHSNKTTEISSIVNENTKKSGNGQNLKYIKVGNKPKNYVKESQNKLHKTKQKNVVSLLNEGTNLNEGLEKCKPNTHKEKQNKINICGKINKENNSDSTNSYTSVDNNCHKSNNLTSSTFSSLQSKEKKKIIVSKPKKINIKNHAGKRKQLLNSSDFYDKSKSANGDRVLDRNFKNKAPKKCKMGNVYRKNRKLGIESPGDVPQSAKFRKLNDTEKNRKANLTATEFSEVPNLENLEDYVCENISKTCNSMNEFNDVSFCKKCCKLLERGTESGELKGNQLELLKCLIQPENMKAIHKLATLFSSLGAVQNVPEEQNIISLHEKESLGNINNNNSFIIPDHNSITTDSINKDMSPVANHTNIEGNIVDNQFDEHESAILNDIVTKGHVEECFQEKSAESMTADLQQSTFQQNITRCSNEDILNMSDNTAMPHSDFQVPVNSFSENNVLLNVSSDLKEASKDNQLPNSGSEIAKLKCHSTRKRRCELEIIHDSLQSSLIFRDVMNCCGIRSCRLKTDLLKVERRSKRRKKQNCKSQDGEKRFLPQNALSKVSLKNGITFPQSTQEYNQLIDSKITKSKKVLYCEKVENLKTQSLSSQKRVHPLLEVTEDEVSASHVPDHSPEETNKDTTDLQVSTVYDGENSKVVAKDNPTSQCDDFSMEDQDMSSHNNEETAELQAYTVCDGENSKVVVKDNPTSQCDDFSMEDQDVSSDNNKETVDLHPYTVCDGENSKVVANPTSPCDNFSMEDQDVSSDSIDDDGCIMIASELLSSFADELNSSRKERTDESAPPMMLDD